MAGIANDNSYVEGLKATLDIIDDRIRVNTNLSPGRNGSRTHRVLELEEVKRQVEDLMDKMVGGA
jgi:hypothetical protein